MEELTAMDEADQFGRGSTAKEREKECHLGNADGVDPVTQFFPHKKPQDLERGFEPERRGDNENLLQPRRVATLQQGQYALTQLVIKVRVLGVGHVVDENEARPLGARVCQCVVKLVHDALERCSVTREVRVVPARSEQRNRRSRVVLPGEDSKLATF